MITGGDALVLATGAAAQRGLTWEINGKPAHFAQHVRVPGGIAGAAPGQTADRRHPDRSAPRQEHRDREDRAIRGRDRGDELSDHGAGVLGPASEAVRRVRPRRGSSVPPLRRTLQRANEGRVACTSRRRRCKGAAPAAFKPFEIAPRGQPISRETTVNGRRVPYIVRLETGTINRAVYQIAVSARPGVAAARRGRRRRGMERPSRLHLRRQLHGRLHPGRELRRRDERHASLARLRRRLVVAERLRQQLQRRRVGRDADDGEGALHRDRRRAGAHDRLGRLGRSDGAVHDRAELSGPARRHHPVRDVPGRTSLLHRERRLPPAAAAVPEQDHPDRRAEARDRRILDLGHLRPVIREPSGPARPDRLRRRHSQRSCATTRSRTRRVRAARSTTAWSTIFGRDPKTGFARRPHDNVGVQYRTRRAERRR